MVIEVPEVQFAFSGNREDLRSAHILQYCPDSGGHAAVSQDHAFFIFHGYSGPFHHVGKTGIVRIVSAKPSVFQPHHGIDAADLFRLRRDLIQKRNDRLLIGNGDIEPVIVIDLHELFQLIPLHFNQIITVTRCHLVDLRRVTVSQFSPQQAKPAVPGLLISTAEAHDVLKEFQHIFIHGRIRMLLQFLKVTALPLGIEHRQSPLLFIGGYTGADFHSFQKQLHQFFIDLVDLFSELFDIHPFLCTSGGCTLLSWKVP